MNPIGSRPSTSAADLMPIEPASGSPISPNPASTGASTQNTLVLGASPVDNMLRVLGAENPTPAQREALEAAIANFRQTLDRPDITETLGRLRALPTADDAAATELSESERALVEAGFDFLRDVPLSLAAPRMVEPLRQTLEQAGVEVPADFADLPLRELGDVGGEFASRVFSNFAGEEPILAGGLVLAGAALGSEFLGTIGVSPRVEFPLGDRVQVGVEGEWGFGFADPQIQADITAQPFANDTLTLRAGYRVNDRGDPTRPEGGFVQGALQVPIGSNGVRLSVGHERAGDTHRVSRAAVSAPLAGGSLNVGVARDHAAGLNVFNARYTIEPNANTQLGVELRHVRSDGGATPPETSGALLLRHRH